MGGGDEHRNTGEWILLGHGIILLYSEVPVAPFNACAATVNEDATTTR